MYNAVLSDPMCKNPVGEGSNLVLTGYFGCTSFTGFLTKSDFLPDPLSILPNLDFDKDEYNLLYPKILDIPIILHVTVEY